MVCEACIHAANGMDLQRPHTCLEDNKPRVAREHTLPGHDWYNCRLCRERNRLNRERESRQSDAAERAQGVQ